MTVQIETEAEQSDIYAGSIADVLKLKGKVEIVPVGSLPNDGKVIDDQRVYD